MGSQHFGIYLIKQLQPHYRSI
ncbi:unnamed protein product [Spirodela intermedia]|uniref:Uncharacterized protein n=2 Tax=Spirodela intermedia TaxID=51605 RepID=A0A7I8IDG0_SPIIN|nr:unnamed protein product [Spirodela intermedia]CAA6655425.1 unnamed protein product [Spirodela intermedia]CAA7390681.1 unnamed protein product [Spirodela intermedia]